MQPIAVDDLIAAIGGAPNWDLQRSETVSRIEIDSRKIRRGDVFWAVEGKKFDGHDFVEDAFQNGASLAIVESGRTETHQTIEVPDTLQALWDFAHWYRNQFDALVIGVTGSVGKTTTRRMIHNVLSAKFHGVESPQNYNNEFGVPLSLLQLNESHDYAVIELGASFPGEIGLLTELARPEVGVITAIGPSHLEDFESFENIVTTKAALIQALPQQGFAILNGDDRNIRKVAPTATCPITLVGEKKTNNLIAEHITFKNNEITFHVNDMTYQIPAVGHHHVTPALIAIAIGQQIGMTTDEIKSGLMAFEGVPGRCQVRKIGPWTVIDDTYNANPVSMSAACRLLKDWDTEHKRILLAGDMLALGEWSEDFHDLLGQEVTRSKIDQIIAFGSQADSVARSARKNGMDAGCLGVTRDVEVAMLLLDLWLDPGDVILIKGSRGMKMEAFLPRLEQLARNQTQTSTFTKETQRKVA